ncbi:MAG: hypothetical protein GKC03_09295 [Methanomassiliicoccales archaeon]|nr:hypothetical protein [Methanomassiliicoccales archaeon]
MIDQLGREELIGALSRIGESLPRKVKVFMIGGGAMALRGEKVATKDVDIILTTDNDMELICESIRNMGFHHANRIPEGCEALVDAEIFEGDDRGVRFDLFLRRVCNGLELSEGMISRSDCYQTFGNLVLMLCSREDIFLLKSVTERNRDLEDMLILFRKGLDESLILQECAEQNNLINDQERIWESFLLVKLDEMEEEFEIRIPWKRRVRLVAEKLMIRALILDKVREGIGNIPEISKDIGIEDRTIRKISYELEKDGLIDIDRSSIRFHID